MVDLFGELSVLPVTTRSKSDVTGIMPKAIQKITEPDTLIPHL
jgi:hypothetical protein